MIFSFVNGYAVMFNNSRSYVRGPGVVVRMLSGVDLIGAWPISQPKAAPQPPDPRPVASKTQCATPSPLEKNNGFIANRSVYYGTLALIGYVTSQFWLTIFAQAFAVASVVAIFFFRCLPRPSMLGYLVTITGLALLTSVGPFVAFIMPDIFAPVMILAIATIFFYPEKLSRLEFGFLFLTVAFATLAHASHVVILAAMTGLFVLWSLFDRVNPRRWGPGAIAAVACVAIGLAGQIAFNEAVLLTTGEKALVLPHMTAHLEDMGPGYRFIEAKCGAQPFVVCRFKDRLPLYWEDFLGDPDPKRGVFSATDMATKHGLSDEQYRFALAVFAYDPIGVVGGMSKDAASQIVRFSLNDLRLTPEAMKNYAARYPPAVVHDLARSRLGRDPGFLRILSQVDTWVAIASMGVIAVFAARAVAARGKRSIDPNLWRWSGFILVAVLVNAVTCGILASPYDRFQARVIWLLPLVASVLTMSAIEARRLAHAPRRPVGRDLPTPRGTV